MSPEVSLDDESVLALVRDGYDATAERYLAMVTAEEPAGHPRHDWVSRLLRELSPGSSILELGCGAGLPTASALVGAGHALTGVDLSSGQIALARQLVPGGTFMVGDMLALDLQPASYDAVVALFTFVHVPRRHYGELLGRIHVWLRPGGRFLASFGTNDSPGWLETDLLGLGAQNWTNSLDASTTRRLLRTAALVEDRAEVIEWMEASGPESWLWFLGHRDG